MTSKMDDEIAELLFDAEEEEDGGERAASEARERIRGETQLRRVPWASWAEWCAVRDAFCAGTPAGAAEGIARVRLWRARGAVPVSVDATARLAAYLHGARATDADTAAAALALVRFVNGLTETAQTGTVAVSVRAAAARVGLPAALVEYRHQATHALLPDAAATARAARTAHAWLLAHYWAPQAAAVGDAAARIAALLDEYRSAVRAGAGAGTGAGASKGKGKDKGKGTDTEINPGARTALGRVVALVDRVTGGAGATELLAPALVHGGFLVPHTARPRVFEAVPEPLLRLWAPALAHFARAWDHFAPALCILLARRVTFLAQQKKTSDSPTSQYEQSLLAAWFAHLVSASAAPALARDRSALLATLSAALAAAHPPRSPWTERVAWAATGAAGPATRQRLAQLLAIAQSTDRRSTSVGLLVAGRVDLSATGAGGQAAALPLDVIEKQTALLLAAASAADEDKEDGNSRSKSKGEGKGKGNNEESEGWPLVRGTPRPIGLDENGELPALDVPEGAAFAAVEFVPTHDMPRAAWTPLGDSDFAQHVVCVEPGETSSKRRCCGDDDGKQVKKSNGNKRRAKSAGKDDSNQGKDDETLDETGPVLDIKALDAALGTLIGVL